VSLAGGTQAHPDRAYSGSRADRLPRLGAIPTRAASAGWSSCDEAFGADLWRDVKQNVCANQQHRPIRHNDGRTDFSCQTRAASAGSNSRGRGGHFSPAITINFPRILQAAYTLMARDRGYHDDYGSDQPHYDVQQVCENGHQVTDSLLESPQHGRDFCDKCGARALSKCPACEKNIPGRCVVPSFFGGSTRVPEHCPSCGVAFPWRGKQAVAAPWGAPEVILVRVLAQFHAFARQLRHRYGGRATFDIEDECDVQDALHALLRIFFDDIRPEEWTPSYAGGSARMDFLLKAEQIVLEVKKTRKGLGAKEVGDQLLVDIGRYGAHPDGKKLICFVYDPEGRVANAQGAERDLTRKHGALEVKVFIWPKA